LLWTQLASVHSSFEELIMISNVLICILLLLIRVYFVSFLIPCHLILGKDTRILATGGASNNLAILQVLADVFSSPVYTLVSV